MPTIPLSQRDYEVVERLELDQLAPGQIHRLGVRLLTNELGRPVDMPILVARGTKPGSVFGLTAAIHGNELNGIPIIHRIFSQLDPAVLTGTVVAVPVVNLPGYRLNRREFAEGVDLNRLMPGKEIGNEAEVYAHRFMTRIVDRFEYLVDLHTASFGRANSLYVRANMNMPVTKNLARLIGAQIIVHNEGADGTLRSAAVDLGIHAVTVEVGDPNRFQRGLIRSSHLGVWSIPEELGFLERDGADEEPEEAVLCSRSYWLYTDGGGLLEVFPNVADYVKIGEKVARLFDVYGTLIREYAAPEAGIVIGKSINPVARTGSRILHLGIVSTQT